MGLSIHLLGLLKILRDGEPLTGFDSDKTRALLTYLAVEADRPHRREKLAGLLWPDYPEQSARTSLRRALANLRQVIGDHLADPPYLLITPQTIQFNLHSDYWLDVASFSVLVEGKGGHSPEIGDLEEAVLLYKGEFLEGFTVVDSTTFEEWALITREALRQRLLRALHRLAGYYEGMAAYERAMQFARRQLELDAYQEDAHRQVMRILAFSGQRNAALAQYETCKHILLEELGVEPSPETVRLCEQIRLGELTQTPAPTGGPVRGYELRELLGEGHFGAVYRAYQGVIGRDVAVKIIQPGFANQPDFVRRFETEAQIVARLEHPHIVPLYDYWREPDGAYLVMRWLRGGSLETSLRRGPWNIEAAVHLVEQISAALAVAHRQGVVHRDVKPSNILLDDEANAYLSDFGIATLTGPIEAHYMLHHDERVEDLATSLGYVSPEIVAGGNASKQTDVYSLGVVLYELLTGQHPFPDTSGQALLKKHQTDPLPSVLTLRPDLPPGIDGVIQQATAKDPLERFPDTLSLAQAFRQAIFPKDHRPAAAASLESEIRNPYKGLRSFQEADAGDFFGREALFGQLVSRLAEEGPYSRFLALVGASGSGKSSVVKAGLLPALRNGALPGSEDWYIVEITPGDHPLEELETALLRVAVNPPASLLEQLKADERGLLRAVRRSLPAEQDELLLVIDQFEELFTLTEAENERLHFLKLLSVAVCEPGSCLRVVVTLRADYYDRPLLYPAFGRLLQARLETILPLSPDEVERAIIAPAELVGMQFESGVVAAIVTDVSEQPGSLPLLQYALTELFEHRQRDLLTLAAYRESGGVQGALGRRAEELYASLDETGQQAARQVFLRLVTPGEGSEDARRRVQRSELATIHISNLPAAAKALNQVLELFGRYRLLTFDRDLATRLPTVEIAHEALLHRWARLKDWINLSRTHLLQGRRLTLAAGEWVQSGQDASFLLYGARLDGYRSWSAETGLALTPGEQAYIEASLEAEQARQTREQDRLAREKALERRTHLLRNTLLIGLALIIIACLVVAGGSLYYATSTILTPSEQKVASWDQGRGVAFNPLSGDLFVCGDDNKPALREPLTGEVLLTFGNHYDQVLNVSNYTRDGDQVATASMDGTARIWDAETGTELRQIRADMGLMNSIALSPSGSLVAATSQSGIVRVWVARTGVEYAYFRRSKSTTGIDFSPDETLLAYASLDNAVIIIDLQTLQQVFVMHVDRGSGFTDVVFSLDGRLIAATNLDGLVRVWDATTGEQISTLRGFERDVYGLAFSPDGRRIAAGGSERSVRVWDAETGSELYKLTGHRGSVLNLAFSPDGALLASGSDRNETIVWDLAP